MARARTNSKPMSPRSRARREERAMAAKGTADESAKRVLGLNRKQVAKMLAEIREMDIGHAPTMRAARSDLLAMLQVVALEFLRRYYPDAEYASLSIGHPEPDGGRLGPTTMIAIPLPRNAERRAQP